MAKGGKAVNLLKRIYRKLANDPKTPPHIRLISAHCLAKLDDLIDIEFLRVISTKKVGNPAGNPKKDEEITELAPEQLETTMEEILSSVRGR